MKTIVLSLGGSIIMPDDIDIEFLKRFRDLVIENLDKYRFIIVCGGGKLCRNYNDAAKKIADVSSVDLDLMGIAATRMNAELVRAIFGELAYESVIKDPTISIVTDKQIVIGSGFTPGNSSDKVAVMLAKKFDSDTVVNMTNVQKVFSDDPKIKKDAEPFDKISWVDYIKIIGEKWIPGRSTPFDPVASKLGKQYGIETIILQGLDNLKKYLDGKEFLGTIIS